MSASNEWTEMLVGIIILSLNNKINYIRRSLWQ